MAISGCCRSSCLPPALGSSDRSYSPQILPAAVDKDERRYSEQSYNAQHKLALCVHGMDCGSCASDISLALSEIKTGVLHHTISLADSKLLINYDISAVSKSTIISAIEAAGYSCQEIADSVSDAISTLTKSRERHALRGRFLLAAFSSLLVYCFSALAAHRQSILNKAILPGLFLLDMTSVCLMIPLFLTASKIYASALYGVQSRRINSNTLVACAITASLGYSLAAIAFSMYTSAVVRPETFFETVGELTSFTLLGRWFEMSASSMTTNGISSLLRLIPERATRLDAGEEASIDATLLAPFDVCVVRKDERFPADCKILQGTTSVDESAMSGDFLPGLKKPGDTVFAGTLNIAGAVTCEVSRVGMDTHINQTAALLLDAQANKAEIELLAERYASFLVPVLMGLSIFTFLLWLCINPQHYLSSLTQPDIGRLMLSIKLGISVLVVSCPCALTIATPTAVMVGTAVGASHGILIKGASVLETLAKATDIVFDKTGTLTQGRLEVSKVLYTSVCSEERKVDLWHLIHKAESTSESVHPIKRTLNSFFQKHYSSQTASPIEIQSLEDVHGRGIHCTISEWEPNGGLCTLSLGNRLLYQHHDVVISDDRPSNSFSTSTDSSRTIAGTQIFVTINNDLMCIISFCDEVKQDAARTVAQLHNMGKTLWMFTGDDDRTAQMVARHVKISDRNVLSECTVTSKANAISHLQQQGKIVVMIGDGINDSLALTTADVGVSMSGATNVATNSADIILMQSGGISDVASAIFLAQHVYKRVIWNLAFSIGWNVAIVPLAMGILLPWNIYLPPATAAFLMSLSCLSIIVSSLTLNNWEKPSQSPAAERMNAVFRQNNEYQWSLRKLLRKGILVDRAENGTGWDV